MNPWHRTRSLISRLFVVALASTTLAIPMASGPALASDQPTAAPMWLCRPGLFQNPCASGLNATVIAPDGSRTIERFQPARHPKVDCFYVYPTLLTPPTSLLIAQPLRRQSAALAAARMEVGRFSSSCRLFVPVYRQLTNLGQILPSKFTAAARRAADADVDAAWHYYLAHYNHGRGVIMIGHSQGGAQILRLLHDEVQNTPSELHRLVAAYVLGANVLVPKNGDVGGDLTGIPACRSAQQHGCIVAYSMFDTAPDAKAFFGHASNSASGYVPPDQLQNMQVLCVNPASPGGGSSPLHPYLPSARIATLLFGSQGAGLPLPDVLTDFVSYPGQVSGECQTTSDASWFQINHPAPGPNAPLIKSDLIKLYGKYPDWGLHMYDMSADQGDLVALAAQQVASWH